ncbi:hypothetical protein DL766_001443 [Monosporascus sp. MC13-8B]|uniref:Uncharacterized protein n=1 Tax=Monosporascus cannonballus TaxID=155416 RepID=A0ABY0HBL6_9PEZI|nr:hypothetical protein DL762_003079 [Monosporascus cannonballus]RYP00444.1 hypothetical protein DL763_000796 [Monosporascus cannonballus]RYP37627.1 hypothetical protein DL766_001443 [Monosporascus sp. MC13-8B]
MWDIPNLRKMIDDHLAAEKERETEFSSWTPLLDVALGFATRSAFGYIAVIDTWLLDTEIYNTADLALIGLAIFGFDYEYLAYGPISGPAYHCVSVDEIYASGYGQIDDTNMGDACVNGLFSITSADVALAKGIARILWTSSDNSPDAIVTLTAVLVNIQSQRVRDGLDMLLSPVDINTFLRCMQEEIQALRPMPCLSSSRLLSPFRDIREVDELGDMIKLLLAFEEGVVATVVSGAASNDTSLTTGLIRGGGGS